MEKRGVPRPIADLTGGDATVVSELAGYILTNPPEALTHNEWIKLRVGLRFRRPRVDQALARLGDHGLAVSSQIAVLLGSPDGSSGRLAAVRVEVRRLADLLLDLAPMFLLPTP